MADDDSDDDLWNDLEEDVSTLNVSANLVGVVGSDEPKVIHKGEVDEGRLTWVAPTL